MEGKMFAKAKMIAYETVGRSMQRLKKKSQRLYEINDRKWLAVDPFEVEELLQMSGLWIGGAATDVECLEAKHQM